MIINLPWVEQINTLCLPKDFEEQVKTSFKKFTEGTSKQYTFEDKLLYLDNLRRGYLRTDNTEASIIDLIGRRVSYELEENGEMPEKYDIMSTEFMGHCYDEGFRPLRDIWEPYSSSNNIETLKVILKIVQIVVNYEGE